MRGPGRALAASPRILLLDEPLAALDEDTRDVLIELLPEVTAAEGVTALHVTHSRTEAKLLADVAFRLDAGRIIEVEV